MRVIVTGATGFIGTPVCEQLLKAGHSVLAVTRNECGQIPGEVQWLFADISNPSTYSSKISKFSPEVIVHLAWAGIPDFSLAKSLENLNSSINFLTNVLQLDTCRKVLVAGSCFELNQHQGACSEDHLGSPRDNFTWAKHSLRTWLELESLRRNIVMGWMRIFYAYGPRQRSGSLVPTILTSLSQNQTPPIRAPHNANDFIFVDDVAAAFVAAVNSKIETGIYNLGSGRATSVLETCEIGESLFKSTRHTDALRQLSSETSPVNFWAECTKTQQLLGWQPRFSLEEGIRATWESMQRT